MLGTGYTNTGIQRSSSSPQSDFKGGDRAETDHLKSDKSCNSGMYKLLWEHKDRGTSSSCITKGKF